MKTITWIPGTNARLDLTFNKLREIQYEDTGHRLYHNYNEDFMKYVVATTICFDNDEPIMCGSISHRSCWPNNSYRILNRLWKPNVRIKKYPRFMGPSYAETTKSQIEWLKENADCCLYFISRQSRSWTDWVIKNFKDYGINFDSSDYLYLTCPNEDDKSCWQTIIYSGDSTVLETWKRKAY